MSALELELRSDPSQRLDLSALIPGKLDGLSESDIGNIALNTNKTEVKAGDIFKITAGDSETIRLIGLTKRSDNVGDGMTKGRIIVDGDCGSYAGTRMRGGTMEIKGDCIDYAGASMKGGHLIIRGSAGDYAGGRHHLENQGIRGGILQILGSAGHHAAERMRRGIVIINGDAGDYLASRIIAGTVLVSGLYGRKPAYGMRRGTVVLRTDEDLLPTFADCGVIDLPILKMIKRDLEKYDAGSSIPSTRIRRYAGDMASLGKGEILIPV